MTTSDPRIAYLADIGPFTPLQIVPTLDDHELLTQEVQPGAPVQPLTNHGGRTITAAKVQVVFMDGYADDKPGFMAFAAAIVQNGYYVSPDGKDTADGAFLGAVSVRTGLAAAVKDSQLQAWLTAQVGLLGIAPADPNTLFVLMMGPGTTVEMDQGQPASSCSDFCGYHSRTSAGIYYAVICDPACNGCHGNLQAAQGREMIFAHEYGEWRSDPDGDAWYNDQSGMENGDECAWQPIPWGPSLQWTVQPLAVNGQGCGDVPPYVATPTPVPQPVPFTVTISTSGTGPELAGQPVSFGITVAGSISGAATYAWDFGDGQTGTIPSASHVYASAGTFTAKLTIADRGLSATGSCVVTVITAAPVPTPVPPPHDWLPNPALPLGNYFSALLFNQGILDLSDPAGALLAFVLAHPDELAAGGDMAALFAYLQANPTQARAALDAPPLGAGWGAYLDRQGIA